MQRQKEERGKEDISRKEDIFIFYPSFHFGALLSVKVADVTLFFFIQISIKHTAQPDCFLILCLVYRKPDYCFPDQVGGLYERISTKCFVSNKWREGASCEVHHLNKHRLF